MDSTAIEQEAEALLRDAARELTEPREGECLLCFVSRMIDDFGCDTTLRWAARFRDLRAPRATALAQRLGDIGGFCDCEIFLNGYRVAVHLCEEDEWGDLVPSGTPVPRRTNGETSCPPARPCCTGVRRGSTKPCGAWERRRRW